MTKCIADYVGRESNKDMRKSVNDGMELALTELEEPPGDVTTCKTKKCKKDLAQHHENVDKCNNHKAKVFPVVKGQCGLSMKNKLEAMEKHSKLEKNDDVVGPLK